MSGFWSGLVAEDDITAMEKSCFAEFVGPGQKAVLLEMWAAQEIPDNLAFLQEFAPEMVAIEEEPPLTIEEEMC